MKNLFSIAALLMLSLLTGICNAQPIKKYTAAEGFVAHEWGTFTTLRASNGRVLSGLELEEERLPDFVYNLCGCTQVKTHIDSKGIRYTTLKDSIMNVTVKMETPVLYFYSSEAVEKQVAVDVKFNRGTISQWYPKRASGENDFFANIEVMSATAPRMTYVDFAQPRQGSIHWDASILPLSDHSPYTSDASKETSTWVSPRATASNLIKTRYETTSYNSAGAPEVITHNEVEKFLFYRGIGGFGQSVSVEFNTQHNLVISNSGLDAVAYALVYEKKRDGTMLIWWSGAVNGKQKKVIAAPAKNGGTEPAKELENFVAKLTEAGLYEDEARAMLNTWTNSYFGHEGLKVFWIVPEHLTDGILPMQIEPQPNVLRRVLVARSELLTPEFEKELAAMSAADFENTYKNDRFFYAYHNVRTALPKTWTDYNDSPEGATGIEAIAAATGFEVFPNPVSGVLTVNLINNGILKVIASNGSIAVLVKDARAGKNSLSMQDLAPGMYVVKAEYNDGTFDTKRIIKE